MIEINYTKPIYDKDYNLISIEYNHGRVIHNIQDNSVGLHYNQYIDNDFVREIKSYIGDDNLKIYLNGEDFITSIFNECDVIEKKKRTILLDTIGCTI